MTPSAATLDPSTAQRAAAGASVQKGPLPLPPEIVICPWGESRDVNGLPIIVNEYTASVLPQNQAKFGFEEIALDFNHSTVPTKDADGNPQKVAEPLPVAAYGTLSVEAGKGVIFKPTTWTPEGERFYTGRHYRDLSPTIAKNEKGEVTFIHSVALCRQGQIRELHAYHAAEGMPALTAFSTPIPTIMENTAPDYRALLIKKLGLADTATDEEIIAAVTTAEVETKSADTKTEEAPETTPMSSETTPDNVIALSARMDKIERDNLVAEATRQGKLIPLSAEALDLTPLSVLKDMIAKLPTGQVPVTTPTTAKEPPAVTALSAEEKEVCARMGLTEDQFRAAKI